MQGLVPSTTFTINIRGRLIDLSQPRVMGILNVTPDSFYARSRKQSERDIIGHVERMLNEGADFIDVGACSTRPGASEVSADEEMARIVPALKTIRHHFPEAIVSVDTFRADVAERSIEACGADIVNDVSGGDQQMYETVARLGVPYVLTCTENSIPASYLFLSERIAHLHALGQKDILLDPGFGFGKTLDENYRLLAHLTDYHELGLPLLVGVSRKSMIHRLLNTSPEEALTGTIALNTLALAQGATILRVHDVREAAETIKIVRKCLESE